MPSRLNNGAKSSRFELPALDLNFGSITDGTNIPPPPKSPVQKAATPARAPSPPPKDQGKKDGVANGQAKSTTNGNIAGTKRLADDSPLSPVVSNRPGSLRRLFSRTKLSNSYAEGDLSASGSGLLNGSRRGSQSGGSVVDDRKSKRGSSFFRRLRGDGPSKRSSLIFDSNSSAGASSSPNKPTGPPPPMIPELRDLEKESTGFGSDLFKNIK